MSITKRILWCITGSGSFLRGIYRLFQSIKEKYDLEIGIVLSKAGVEVARIYGILDKLGNIATGGRYDGIYSNVSESGITSDGVPLGGRVSLRRYKLVVVAPASTNTVAKIVCGIADTPPTLVVNQALKSNVPAIIFPSDYEERALTHLPCYIDEEKCNLCYKCVDACPNNAIYVDEKYPRINYRLCRGCEACKEACSVSAIRCWEKTYYTPSKIDLKNVEKLRSLEGITVVDNLLDLEKRIIEFLRV